MSHSLDMRDKQLTHVFILKGFLKDPYIQAEETDIQRLLHLYRRHAKKAHIFFHGQRGGGDLESITP